MREDLLGYLLGALEPDDMERVERALREDPDLRDQLADIQRMLRPLEQDRGAADGSFEPPPGLVARTLRSIDQADAANGPVSSGGRLDRSGAPAAAMQTADEPPRSTVASVSGWGWWDSLVSGLAAAALIGLILPAILRGRFEARRTACQENLRQLGQAITAYALRDAQLRLPQLAAEGPEAFSGVYAVRLRDSNLIARTNLLWCPSTDRPEPPASLPSLPPTLDQLRAAAQGPLAMMQRAAGGSYAYSLGIMDGGQYRSPRYEGRTTFAILADAPTSGVGSQSVRVGHDQRGVNVLYEDGHVAFMPLDVIRRVPDPPFVNHHGTVEAGVNADDATLAPSWRPPFTHVRQR